MNSAEGTHTPNDPASGESIPARDHDFRRRFDASGGGLDALGGAVERVLIVALDSVIPAERRDANVLVVAPALNSFLRHWLSDVDAARRRADERAAAFVDQLERTGVHAEGRVGDADPLLAIADALSAFAADEIVIAAEPERSRRLVEELVSRVRDRFALPVLRAGESLPMPA